MSHDRLSRQQIKHDEFVSGVARASIWVEDHRRLVIAIGGALLAALVLGIGGQSWWHARQEKALTLLFEVERRFHTSVQGRPDEYQQYSRQATPYATREEKYTAVVQAADDLLAKHGSGASARQARYYRALALREMGRHDEATAELEKLVAQRMGRLPRALARLALAETHELAGRTAEAANVYRTLADEAPEEFPREMALLGLARCLEREQKQEEARALYRRVIEEFGASPYVAEAQSRLRRLG